MKMHLATLTLTLSLGVTSVGVALAVESLRGDADLNTVSATPDKRKLDVVQGGFDRSYKEQPPLVPHGVEKYSINLRQNGCMKCHSEATAEKENTKATPESHFLDRDGNKLDRPSARRYFCNQCHTVQLDGAPLVENVFQGRR